MSENGVTAKASGAQLRLRNLTKTFGAVTAVDQVSLDVPAGAFVSLLGPSGSGKTTTLNLIAGFLSLDSGDILLDERSVADIPPHKRNIGMVFQSYSLFPHMTVAQNVGFPLRMRTRLSRDGSRSCSCRISAAAIRASFQAVSSSGWRWRARWFRVRASC
jgi:ABC-type Fe3+/spermidine/putrescine transport system ATPase subunit